MSESRYLELLGESDLALLGRASGLGLGAAGFRANPAAITTALRADGTFASLFGPEPDATLTGISPLLVFAVLVHRGAAEVATAGYVTERVSSQLVVPVFDSRQLALFAAETQRRLFVVELLGSFTRVMSGPRWERRAGRWHRRRFSELDPASLALLLRDSPRPERPGIYRRLGDLALFLTGVFGDHVGRRTLSGVDVERLLRSIPDSERPDVIAELDRVDGLSPLLRALGPRWYRLAARTSIAPATVRGLETIAEEFDLARRFLVFVTNRYLFERRDRLFPWQPG